MSSRRRSSLRTAEELIAGLHPGAGAAQVRAAVDRLLDRRAFRAGGGVPSLALDAPGWDGDRPGRGAVDLDEQARLVRALVTHGLTDVALDVARRAAERLADAGPHRWYHPLTGRGVGPPFPDAEAVVARMQPLAPPPELTRPVQAVPVDRADAHPELRALYRHPDARPATFGPEGVTSSPAPVVRAVLRGAAAVTGVPAPPGEGFGPWLEALLLRLGEHVRRARGLEAAYPRFCDLGALAVSAALRAHGVPAAIRWTPYLHYFVVARDPQGGAWIADLTGRQFADHPASRPGLLLERATLRIREGAATPALFHETRYAVDAALRRAPPWRPNAFERYAFGHVLGRHRRAAESAGAPPGYGRWLDTLEPGPGEPDPNEGGRG